MKTRPKFKTCKRFGTDIFEACQTPRFTRSENRNTQPQKGKHRSGSVSDFSRQHHEKQRLRLAYGVSERQLVRYIAEATAKKGVSAVESLRTRLESRLDNVIYRLGFAPTRGAARQLVSHGHIMVDGKRVTVPSSTVPTGSTVCFADRSKERAPFISLGERLEHHEAPSWLSLNAREKTGTVRHAPAPQGVEQFNMHTVIEFYGR